ncbi:hypothetical protein AAFO92_00195 [Roseovarius sp. CAU 1744]|uniref:hypothetical protein n=1 Tax=Roseovarius sp. CAU 1744 TaxID=3140368 RepID=UPI00325C25A5
MTMDIHIHSKLSLAETSEAISDVVEKLGNQYGNRFWFSKVFESSKLTKELLSEDFDFKAVCGFVVTDVTKEFEGLDVIARSLRNTLKQKNSIVIYAETGELFPKEDYT